MTSKLRKSIAVVLAALMLLSAFAVTAFADSKMKTTVPTVYIIGQGTPIYNAEGEQIAPVNEPDGYLSDALSACMGPFLKSIVSGDEADTEAYRALLMEWVAPLYEEAKLDNNGNPAEGQYHESTMYLSNYNYNNNGYLIKQYRVAYDWRLDPMENADMLNTYIENVKRATGCSKVNLVGRCEGSTIAMAYLQKYGHDSIKELFFLMPAYHGLTLVSQMFSGHLKFDAYAISKWLDAPDASQLVMPEGELIEFLTAIVDMSAAMYGLDATNTLIMPIYEKVLKDALPEILLASYATMPGMWAMVSDRDYEDAMKFIFTGHEEEYAGLIAKIKNYRALVKDHTEDILNACLNDGIEIGNITKYGYPAGPIFEESMMLSDGGSTVYDVSFGATTANINETLSDKYINQRTAEGKGKYISPDKLIDASTCFLPDTTWFIGNLSHPYTPDWADDLMAVFFQNDGMTVDTYESTPQFLVYTGNEDADEEDGPDCVVPLTAENADDTLAFDTDTDFSGGFSVFYAKVIAFLGKIANWVRSFINGIVDHANGRA